MKFPWFEALKRKCSLRRYSLPLTSLLIILVLGVSHIKMLVYDSITILGLRGAFVAVTLFTLISALYVYSFLLTVFLQSPPVPAFFRLRPNEVEEIDELKADIEVPRVGNPHAHVSAARAEEKLRKIIDNAAKRCPAHMLDSKGFAAHCLKCRLIRPDRCRHCRRCKRCILRRDHHCEFFGNCIHLRNYKAFLCTVFYGFLLCLQIVVVTPIVKPWKLGKTDPLGRVLFFFCELGVFGLIAFFGYHCFITSQARTHNEVQQGNGTSHVDFFSTGSKWENLQLSLGPWYLWWWPRSPADLNGVIFPVNTKYCTKSFRSLNPPKEQPTRVEIHESTKAKSSASKNRGNVFAACMPAFLPFPSVQQWISSDELRKDQDPILEA